MKVIKKKNKDEQKPEENDYIVVQKKCVNCGASLKINKQTMTCRCNYCRTEYYVKENDITAELSIAGQIVELKIRGQLKKFYIGKDEFHKIWGDSYRNIKGELVPNLIATKEKITLIEI